MEPYTRQRLCLNILQPFPFQLKCFISQLTLPLYLPLPVRRYYPIPTRTGIGKRLKQCAGCHQPLLNNKSKKGVLLCCFRTTGFDDFIPCGTGYHISCLSLVSQFRSRRTNNDGLCFPPVTTWPTFICEACTVQSVTQRELTTSDHGLLVLERVRMLDTAWAWARGTHRQYQSQFKHIQRFEEEFDVSVLTPHRPVRPPATPDIPLIWCLEANACRTVRHVS